MNTTVVGDQVNPSVAMGEDGRFVVAWQGPGGDGTLDIFARRYDASGNPVSAEFKVNHFTALDQLMPAVAMNALGQFVIAWVSNHPAATAPEIDPEKSVFVQWFDANGVSTGDEVLVHNYVKDAQESPSLGIDAAGNFVVAWQSINQDGSTWGVYARQFLANKTPVQPDEFLVNQTTQGVQRLVGVGVRADGQFVIAWQSTTEGIDDGSSTEVYRREYLADGTPESPEILVNTWTEGPQTMPVVGQATTGNYGIFWTGQGFGHVDGIHGRLYDITLVDDPGTPSRLPVGNQFLVAETLGFENNAPAVVVRNDGTSTVAFETFEEDGSGFGIFSQRLNADGTPVVGSRIQVNATTEGDQSAPDIAGNAAGNVLVVWQGFDADGYGIFGRWFDTDGTPLTGEFAVNTTTAGNQQAPAVAMDGSGHAVITWQSAVQDTSGWGVYFKILDSVGDTTGVEQLANTTIVGDQQAPAVAANASQFLIAWQGPGPLVEGEASIEIFAQRFDFAGVAQGTEFQVNTVVQKDQIAPAVAMAADGSSVVIWQAEGQQGSGSDIFGQRLTATGGLSGGEFTANSTTSEPQRSPSVGMDALGNFLVTWQSIHQDGFSWGIYGREYDVNASPLTGEFLVNTRVQGPQVKSDVGINAAGQTIVGWLGNDATHHPAVFGQRYLVPNTLANIKVGTELTLTNYSVIEESPPAAAMNAAREAVVVWTSYAEPEDGSGLGVFAQLLDNVGQPIGARFLVNTVTAGNQSRPAVARNADGQFVIAWQHEAEDGSGYDVYARRYSAAGVPQGPAFLVNSTTALDQTAPTVAIRPDGGFVIAWQSVSIDGFLDIRAQRYLPDGTPVGGEVLINHFTGLDQKDPAIAMNAAGQFVIAWVSDHPALTDPNDTEKSIFVQWFDANGVSIGDEVLVHKFVKDGQEAPAVGIDAAGNFLVAWQSINQDGNTWGVFARHFHADKTPVESREFLVNETREGPQRYVGVGVDRYGRAVITWQSNSHTQDGSAWEVYSRQYGAAGNREGGELPVNVWTSGPQTLPVVAQAPGGDFGIFWLGQAPNHLEGVSGRIYESVKDFGDARAPFPTQSADDGARHVAIGATLGALRDSETDGQPTADATGDDLATSDDEDGLVSQSLIAGGICGSVTLKVQGINPFIGTWYVQGWVDFNNDGDWSDPGERIATDVAVTTNGNVVLDFIAPATAVVGSATARFRLSSAAGLAATGLAPDGEIEDHQLAISPLPLIRRAELEGYYFSNGGLTEVLRNGSQLTFVNKSGGISAGTVVDATHVVATGWSQPGVFDPLLGTLTFANNSVWRKVRQLGGAWLNPAGNELGVRQLGTDVVFTNRHGVSEAGHFIDADTLSIPGWSVTGELSCDARRIVWSNGTVWEAVPDLATTWTNAANQPLHIEQSGASLKFINRLGGTSTGRFLHPDQVVAADWGNIIGNLVGDTIFWTNATVWSPKPITGGNPDLAGVWDVLGQDARILQAEGRMTFVQPNGVVSSGHFVSATEVVDDGTGIHGFLVSNLILWTDGRVWTQLPEVAGPHIDQLGAETKVRQLERSLTFTDSLGVSSSGQIVSPTRFVETTGLLRAGTIVGETLIWDTGAVWTEIPDLRGNWRRTGSGLPTYIAQSGLSALFITEIGTTVRGRFLNAGLIQTDLLFPGTTVPVLSYVIGKDALSFTNGWFWERPAPHALDAVFADPTLWPFV